MIHQDNNLVLVKGKDKTSSVVSWRFDPNKPVVYITYKQGKSYPYNTRDVVFLKNPRIVMLENRIALKDETPVSGAVSLQFFDDYCRIVYKSGYREVVMSARIKVVESALNAPKSKDCFEYFKQLAKQIGLVVAECNINRNTFYYHFENNYDLLSFTYSLDDFVITYFTRGAKFQTLPIEIYTMLKRRISPTINALSTLLFVITITILIIVNIREAKIEKSRS